MSQWENFRYKFTASAENAFKIGLTKPDSRITQGEI